MSRTEFTVETFYPHTIPAWMLADHYEENAPMKEQLKLAPDWSRYMEAQRRGEFLFLACRDAQTKDLVGYMAMFLHPHPHYRDTKVAVDDVHYLMPQYRGLGAGKAMIEIAENCAKERGATMFSMRCKAAQDHGAIFKKLGYELTDLVYIKDLTHEK
jgi:GNAT superfamily N-acetyltransferase